MSPNPNVGRHAVLALLFVVAGCERPPAGLGGGADAGADLRDVGSGAWDAGRPFDCALPQPVLERSEDFRTDRPDFVVGQDFVAVMRRQMGMRTQALHRLSTGEVETRGDGGFVFASSFGARLTAVIGDVAVWIGLESDRGAWSYGPFPLLPVPLDILVWPLASRRVEPRRGAMLDPERNLIILLEPDGRVRELGAPNGFVLQEPWVAPGQVVRFAHGSNGASSIQWEREGRPTLELRVAERVTVAVGAGEVLLWVQGGALYSARDSAGATEIEGVGDDCGELVSDGDRALVVCGSVLYAMDDADRRAIATSPGLITSPTIEGPWTAWAEWDDRAAFGVPHDALSGRVRVRHESGASFSFAMGSGCNSCGAFWPPPRVRVSGGTLGWNYAERTSDPQSMAVAALRLPDCSTD